MDNVRVYNDAPEVAKAAAEQTVKLLQAAIDTYGAATWVLAGGSTPLMAYKLIAAHHQDTIEWQKVTVILGDERIGPLDGPDNNWHVINEILSDLPTTNLRPDSRSTAEEAAATYAAELTSLPKLENGLPRFDVVWLGVGQDGHTLSLFPLHDSIAPSGELVVAVHDSPKPPRDRISLSFRAMQGVQHALILACGEDKKSAITDALLPSSHLPIALVTHIIKTHEGTATWYIDKFAAPTD